MSENEIPTSYDDYVLSLAAKYAKITDRVYLDLELAKHGIGDTVIAGTILQEFHDRNVGLWPYVVQFGADVWSGIFNNDHDEIRAQYEFLIDNPDFLNNLNLQQRLDYPAGIDLGPGNIKLTTAITLLDNYTEQYQDSDPLNIKQYNSDYVKLISDLIDNDSTATAKFAGLMISRGANWFSSHAANWNELSAIDKEALLVAYYRMGEEKLHENYLEANQNDPTNSSYTPTTENTPIAQQYLATRDEVLSVESTKNMYYRAVQTLIEKNYCFGAGTKITTPEGTKPIEEIKAGDTVMAFDSTDSLGRAQLKPAVVTRTFVNQNKELYDVDGLLTTSEHQFIDQNGIFKPLSEFNQGDSFVGSDGRLVPFEGKTKVDGLHTTYNFEVAEFHTYVANSLRVHNDCLAENDLIQGVRITKDGHIIINAKDRYSGAEIQIKERLNADGTTSILERKTTYSSEDATVTETYDSFDSDKNPVGDPKFELAFRNEIINGEALGSIFGANLGKLLVGDNVLAQIGAGTVGATIGGNLLEFTSDIGHSILGFDVPLPDGYNGSQLSFVTEQSLGDIGDDFVRNLTSETKNVLSSLLFAELAEELGIDGFAGDVFTSTGSDISVQLVDNIIEHGSNLDAANLFDGFDGPELVTSLGQTIGSLLANELGEDIVDIDSIGEALFVSVGGSYGGMVVGTMITGELGTLLGVTVGSQATSVLGALILPGIGALIGSVLGQAVGSAVFELLDSITGGFLSDLFEPNPWYYQNIGYNIDTNHLEIVHESSDDTTAELRSQVAMITDAYMETVNTIIDSVGGQVDASEFQLVQGFIYDHAFFGYHHDNGSAYGNDDFKVTFGQGPLYVNADGDISKIVRLGVEYELSKISFLGGNAIKIRAFEMWKAALNERYSENTSSDDYHDYLNDILAAGLPAQTPITMLDDADSLQTLTSYIQIAEQYTHYLENTAAINALIAASPDSPFAIGWLATLLQADALGLNDSYIVGYLDGRDTAATFNDDMLVTADADDLVFADAGNDTVYTYGGDDTVNAGAGNDLVFLGHGDDSVWGEDGDDIIDAGPGNDTIDGGQGADTIDGKDGIDTVSYTASPVGVTVHLDGTPGTGGLAEGDTIKNVEIVLGSAHDDVIHGSEFEDRIESGEGNDSITAYGGDDVIYPGAGDDTVDAGPGADRIYADAGDDTVRAGEGDDEVFGYDGNDNIFGGPGDDLLAGELGDDQIHGEAGNDVIYTDGPGSSGNDYASGGEGDDLIKTGPGNDTLLGDEGDDQLYGEDGDDIIEGGTGNDFIHAGSGQDDVKGGEGDDQILGYSGDDTIEGNDGHDELYGLSGNDSIRGGQGDDLLSGDLGNDTLKGEQGDDVIDGGKGEDLLEGGLGGDTIIGGDNNDQIRGGGGDDTIFGDRRPNPNALPLSESEILAMITNKPSYDNWGLLYQGPSYTLESLVDAPHQMLIINPSKDSLTSEPSSEIPWLASEISQIQLSNKVVFGYVNMAKINSFISDWDASWTSTGIASGELTASAPSWLGDYESNTTRLVDFTANGWQQLVMNRVGDMIERGFNGTLLDDVLEYYFRVPNNLDATSFEQEVSSNAQDMRDFIIDLRIFADAKTLEVYGEQAAENYFQLVVNGAPYILSDAILNDDITSAPESQTYLDSIDAILVENYFSKELNQAVDDTLQYFGDNGVSLLALDTDQVTQQQRIEIITDAVNKGFLPYVTESNSYGVLNASFIEELDDPHVPGDDNLIGGAGNDSIFAGHGNDTLSGNSGNDRLIGHQGDDTIRGGNGDDTIRGGPGNDRLMGQGGNDLIIADQGNDTLVGDHGNDILNGGSGNDYLGGRSGDDELQGSDGNDFLTGDGGNDRLIGGSGFDRILGGNGNDHIEGGLDSDTLIGHSDNDVLIGGHGNDTLLGGSGDDQLLAGNGQDFLAGGTGNDLLVGHAGNDVMNGGEGVDELHGGPGNDLIEGGKQADSLNGGDGFDLFRFSSREDSLSQASDLIRDFVQGTDRMDVSQLGFSGVSATQNPQNNWLGFYHQGSLTLVTDGAGFEYALLGLHELRQSDFLFSTNG